VCSSDLPNHVSQKYDDRSEGQIKSKIGIKNYIID
jgi:hypothetical protein